MFNNVVVSCLNINCEKDFETKSMRVISEVVTCPHCNSKHEIDLDSDGDLEFWYLYRVLES